MSNTEKRWPRVDALCVAAVLIAALQPYVERIEIVGSVRRLKPTVGDLELLFIPRLDKTPSDLFAEGTGVDLASEQLDHLESIGVLAKRKNIAGYDAGWGLKNKLAVFVENGMPVDLFSTTVENWWNSLVIRTGGKEMNLRLTNGANKLNRSLLAYGCGVQDRKTGIVTPTFSENSVFELCGEKYLNPEDRP